MRTRLMVLGFAKLETRDSAARWHPSGKVPNLVGPRLVTKLGEALLSEEEAQGFSRHTALPAVYGEVRFPIPPMEGLRSMVNDADFWNSSSFRLIHITYILVVVESS
jgi:hypothetical protein